MGNRTIELLFDDEGSEVLDSSRNGLEARALADVRIEADSAELACDIRSRDGSDGTRWARGNRADRGSWSRDRGSWSRNRGSRDLGSRGLVGHGSNTLRVAFEAISRDADSVATHAGRVNDLRIFSSAGLTGARSITLYFWRALVNFSHSSADG